MHTDTQLSFPDDLDASWRPIDLASIAYATFGQAHLYLTLSAAPPEVLNACRALLTDAERERVDRLIIPAKKDERTLSRAFLRSVLSLYLEDPPANIPLTQLPDGKPVLDSETSDLTFNISHAAGLIILAVTSGQPIGIDIERVRSPKNMMRIAEQYFAPDEVMHLNGTPEPERPHVFSTLWTRKEAIVKATGHGLKSKTNTFSTLNTVVSLSDSDTYSIYNIPVCNNIISYIASLKPVIIQSQFSIYPHKISDLSKINEK